MKKEFALAFLQSDDPNQRLEGARYLALHAEREDSSRLRRALHVEKVPWISRALERALERTTRRQSTRRPVPIEPGLQLEPVHIIDQMRAEAIEEVAGTMAHELAPIIGLLKLHARKEVPDYSGSRTKNLVDLLGTIVSGIRELKRAVATPRYKEADLPTLLRSITRALEEEVQGWLRFAGQEPFSIVIDPERLCLALQNVLRNSVEAVQEFSRIQPPEIVINWGRAGEEDWISVIDTGPGFLTEPREALQIGSTSKPDHIGFGLATAQQAMRVMEGDVYPSNSVDGSARVEMRWYRNYANSVR